MAWPRNSASPFQKAYIEFIELMTLVDEDKNIPKQAKQAITGLHDYCNDLSEGIETFEAEIVTHARTDETACCLATIPGIGPDHRVADRGNGWRHQTIQDGAAVCRLARPAPRQNSTGGKTRLGRITKTGNREIRKLLVLGATSMVCRADGWNSATGAWLRTILERRPVRLVTVALANKMARIAWAAATRKEVYHPPGRCRGRSASDCVMLSRRMAGGGRRPPDPAGSADQRDAKAVVNSTVQAIPLRIVCLEHAKQIGA